MVQVLSIQGFQAQGSGFEVQGLQVLRFFGLGV